MLAMCRSIDKGYNRGNQKQKNTTNQLYAYNNVVDNNNNHYNSNNDI